MKKTITKQERLQLIGLRTLAQSHYKMEIECEEAMKKIIDDKDDYSIITDYIWENESVDKVLEKMGIKVK